MTFPLGWIPTAIDRANDNSVTFLQMLHPEDFKTNVSSFNKSIENYKEAHPEAEEKTGSLDALFQYPDSGCEPDGLIFHASRVGSTAVALAFDAIANSFAIDEANTVNAAIRIGEEPAKLLRAVVNGLTQFLKPDTRFVIKPTSWNITMTDVYFEAYPNVPWVFLYRDPVEMMVSIVRGSTGWARAYDNPKVVQEVLGISPEQMEGLPYEAYLGLAIDTMFQGALAVKNGRGMFANYADFGASKIIEIAHHFQIKLSDADVQAIENSLKFYSKDTNRQKKFEADSNQKRNEASDEIKTAAEIIINSYQALEAQK